MKWVSLPASRRSSDISTAVSETTHDKWNVCAYVCTYVYIIPTKRIINDKVAVCLKKRILIVEGKPTEFRKCLFGKILNKFKTKIAIGSILTNELG